MSPVTTQLMCGEALVAYFGYVSLPHDNAEYAMAVGEFWVKRAGDQIARGY